jgi:hypothetical protein
MDRNPLGMAAQLLASGTLVLGLACGSAEEGGEDAKGDRSALDVAKTRCFRLIEAGRYVESIDACAEALREAPSSPEVAAALARAREGVAKAAAMAAEMAREAAERAEQAAEEATEVAGQKAEQAAEAAEEAIDAADRAADEAADDLRDGVDDLRN